MPKKIHLSFKKQSRILIASLSLGVVAFPVMLYADSPEPHSQYLRVLASNTSAQSGLIKVLAQFFENKNPLIKIEIKTDGALAILERARHGEADLVITHHPLSEILFMDEGYGLNRTLLMYNQFALFGPPAYQASSLLAGDLLEVLRQLAKDEAPFMVPSLRSGTQMKLSELWSLAGVKPDWPGYEITGSSSASTLRQAAIFGTYAFADIASYVSDRDKLAAKLVPLYRDHIALRNYYSAIVVNGARFATRSQQTLAEEFLGFLVSDRGQSIIKTFGEGRYNIPLFTPASHMDQGLKSRQAKTELENNKRNLQLMIGLAVLLGIFSIITSWLFIRTRKIQHQVLHDSLTGLPNRLLLTDRLEQTVKLSSRAKQSFALLILDLNGFKAINDTYGHHAGDEVLVYVARRLQHILRKSDTVARLGGDEFAILLTDANVAYANQLAQKILFSMKKTIELCDHRLYVGASLGISVFPQHGNDVQTLMRQADAAMYVAKRSNSGVATYNGTETIRQPIVHNQI